MLRTFCDTNKIPYLLFKMNKKPNGKKDCSDGVIPNFQNITYEDAMKWNKLRMKKSSQPDTMNVVIKNTKYMVIDIDDAKIQDELLGKYGKQHLTLSSTKQLPHLWRERHPQDNNTTRVGKKNYDLVYQNVFESITAEFQNATDDMDVFNDWELKSSITKEKIEKVAKCQKGLIAPKLSSSDTIKYKFLLDLIPTSKLDYDEWMRVVFSLHNINSNLKSVALEWSKTSPKYYEDPDEFNIAWDYCKTGDMMCGEGTLKTLAAKYDKEGFIKWFTDFTNNQINPDDLAKDFITAFGEDNLAYTEDKILYIFKNNNWCCDADLSILKYSIRAQSQGNFITLLEGIGARMKTEPHTQMEMLSKLASHYAKQLDDLKKKKIMDDTASFIIQYLSNKVTETGHQPIVFDVNKEQLFNLHFNNGVYDLEAKEFRPREHSDFVTKKLDWDYNAVVNEKILKEVEADFKKIQPDKHEFALMMSWMAYCLCGDTSRNVIKFNIGTKAGNGKSTVPELHQLVFPIYSKVLDQDFFKKGNTKRHKTAIHLLRSPIRMTFIEEIDEKQLDVSYMKNFIAGLLSVEVLFGTEEQGRIQSKTQVIGNEAPVMDSDNGILRRGLQQNFESQFLPEEAYNVSIEGGATRVFKEDINYKKKYENDEYKNAYLQLLLSHFDVNFKIPKKNRDAFKMTLDSNNNDDSILDKIELCLTGLTKKDAIAEFSPLPFRDIKKVIEAKYGSIYNCYKKMNGVKGVFEGIRIIPTLPDDID